MFKVYTIRDVVRVEPKYFGEDLEQIITHLLREKYERTVDKDMGVIIAIWNVRDISEGKIPLGDGACYHEVTFDCLCYLPVLHEVIEGEVSEIAEFGAFVTLGPLDGLVHISQITDDFISFDRKVPMLVGKETGKKLKVGDKVRARIVAISLGDTVADSRIGLTMRQPGLGKLQWIGE